MLITAAICTHHRPAQLAAAIASLERQTLPRSQFEILVIDNTPDAAALRDADRPIANLRLLHQPQEGLAAARNHAVQHARTPVLAFLDDDALADPGWLAALLDGFERFGAAVHTLGGPVRPAWAAPRPAWLADGMLAYLSLVDHGPDLRLLAWGEWVVGANIAYRLDRVRAAGGFSPALGRMWSGRILLSNDEGELAQRLNAAGGGTGWVPGASVVHCIGADRLDPAWFRRRVAWQAVSDFLVQPDHQSRHIGESRAEVVAFLEHFGGAGALAALSRGMADPASAHWQVSAVYHLVLTLLDGAP